MVWSWFEKWWRSKISKYLNLFKKVYDLLVANYVEDDDNMFRFDYSIDFLRWALNPPGYFKDWIIGVKGK